ncbi:MAG: hypothetical protein GWO20_09400, partial [Candidatus Korarchaeota archaeon]|nr:hypothetical protein [Candidatus Korarchaeota archaeon]
MDAEETATTIWRLLNKSEGYSHFEVGPSVIKGYTNEIVLTMSAMAKGEEEITWSYRMGKFCVQVKPSQESLNVRVFPHDGSKDVAGYYHPHVNQRGELCTGNMEELLQESCNRMDVVSTFLITYKLL